jgi:polyketide synthase-like dehydratase family protein/KR domain-containing protein/polyketide synthase family protein/beta-ketoacyl synthase-like protein
MRNEHRIAIVGIGIRYPDATSPGELWENVLSGRHPFPAARDRYAEPADNAVADPISGPVLDVVATALADAGFRDGHGLPKAATSVVLGGGTGATGAICAHFDLGGGGFTVGTGSAATLLPVVAAAASLADHDVDVAIAGGIGRLADTAGLLVLMRENDAIARNRRIYATITGWGVSSDGRDGTNGHRLALARAYQRAGYGIDTVSYFEGHDTPVTDAVALARRSADPDVGPAALGRTGAETGIAGLVRAVLAVHHQVIPPAAGHHEPDPIPTDGLYVPRDAARWPADRPARVGVSARGAEGINTHLAIEESANRQHASGLAKRTVALAAGRQDAELLLLDAPDTTTLRHQVARLVALTPTLAGAELTDLAGILATELTGQPARAAIVATDPDDAHRKLTRLRDALDAGQDTTFDDGIYLGHATTPARIAYLFPGHGTDGVVGALQRRFALADNIVRLAGGPGYAGRPPTWTPLPEAASPCVVAASLAATRVLHALGVDADIAVGAGLGELTAMTWGGALGGGELLRLSAGTVADQLATATITPLTRPVVSTATGSPLTADADLRALALAQLSGTAADHTEAAVTTAVAGVQLAVEVGPGHTLADLARPHVPALSVDTDSQSLIPLLRVIGAAHTLGATIDTTVLLAGRVIRPLLEYVGLHQEPEPQDIGEVPGIEPWVAPFAVDYVRTAEPPRRAHTRKPGTWTVFAPSGHPLADPLCAALDVAGIGDGVLLCLPNSGEDHIPLILEAGRAAAAPPGRRFVIVQHRLGAAALARTLHLAAPSVATTVVGLADPAPGDPGPVATAVRRVVAEVVATTGFTEVRYDADGNRTVPVLRAVPRPAGVIVSSPLGDTDVLLATGGGRGMAAECALAVAQDSGARVALLGRADPATDAELAANLARLTSAGVRHRYERIDVTAPDEVAAAVARIEADLGTVTAILHGAAAHEPNTEPDLASFQRAVAPKVLGLRAVLDAVAADRIKLLVTFGSIEGRAGLRGAPQHVLADDWTSELTVHFGREHPRTRAVTVAWSVWSGAVTGRRRDLADALRREGVTPIPTDGALAVLRRILADPSVGPEVLVSGRVPTLAGSAVLPRTRFVDRILVHYPGVELVTETELSTDTDPYLDDHELTFPAVLGIEAMVQVASAVAGLTGPPLLENVEFGEPLVVPAGESTTIRLAALVRDTETVDVVVRSGRTGFATDHIRARLRGPRAVPARRPESRVSLPSVPLDPITELYGGILFQGKRFQRLLGYRRVTATRVVAEVGTTSQAPWFAPALPQELLAADPGTRDAVLQAIQASVPDATLVPVGVARLYLSADHDAEYVVVDARERNQDGDIHYYDVDVLDPAGTVVERWEGLTLRAIPAEHGPWVPALVGPHIERTLRGMLGGHRTVVVEPDPVPPVPAEQADLRAAVDLAAGRAFGHPVRLRYGRDGRPEAVGANVSAAHDAGMTLLVTGRERLGCDIGTVLDRSPAEQAGLLGAHVGLRDRLMTETGEPATVATARVLGALASLRTTGATSTLTTVAQSTLTLTMDRGGPDGWVLLRTGDAVVATWVTTINDRPDPVVFAVLSGEERCHG